MKAPFPVLLLVVATVFFAAPGSATAPRDGASAAVPSPGCTAAPSFALGNHAAPQDRSQQQYRASVDMVLIDCIVLDPSGNFVHGLSRDDFRLSEEGDEVDITFFSEQHYGAPPAPATGDNAAAAPASDTVVALPRYLVVFVDAFDTAPDEWDRLRPALATYMRESLTPNDRVLVAILTADGQLRVAPEFTSSAGVLESTLGYIKGNPEIRERTRLNERQLVSSLQAETVTAGGGDSASAAGESTALRTGAALAGFYALERRDQVLHTLDTMISLAEHLDRTYDIAGPKTMLFLSGGLPEQPGSNYYYILDEYAQQSGALDRNEPGVGGYNPTMNRSSSNSVQQYITATVGKLNRLNYTVYAVDARGAADFAGEGAASPTRTPISPEARTHVFQDAQNGLGTIARATGGLSFTGTNNFDDAMAKMHADTAYRYVLGYVPPQHADKDIENGKFFRVQVAVTRPGLTVRAREGYVEK